VGLRLIVSPMTTSPSRGGPSPTAAPQPPATTPPATPEQTRIELLERSRRGIVPLRKIFVQQGHGLDTRPGPLADFAARHDERALDALLLFHASASREPWELDHDPEVWIRALNLRATGTASSTRAAFSKIVGRLVKRQLVRRERRGRKPVITLLREDGTGEPYHHPWSKSAENIRENYLRLPHSYWSEGYAETFKLPGKVMLLIALSRPDDFWLPQERVREWYGISADTASRGLHELRDADILTQRTETITAPLSPTGLASHLHYTLAGPFSREAQDLAAKRGERMRSARRRQ